MAINDNFLNQLKSLSKTEKLSVIQILMHTDVVETHKITELSGLGKEIWVGTDAQEFIDKERSSWA